MRFHGFLVLGVLVGCGGGGKDVDSDGDGLMDGDEEDFGTDPDVVDTDGDGLTDLEEYDLGTDGTAVDSDGDTYSDFDEVTEGKDPTDPDSRIYKGYWPYNPNKSEIENPGWTCCGNEGEVLPKIKYPDQYGDDVNVYDFAMHGKPVVVDLSGMWCVYCQELAKWLSGGESVFEKYSAGQDWAGIPEWIQNGDFYWVTVLDSKANQSAADADDPALWDEDYPNEKVAVLADTEFQMAEFLFSGADTTMVGYPALMLLDENMVIEIFDTADYFPVLQELGSRFGN